MLSFAITIFTGAFLLFQVQPLIGKYILPWFGGSPNVWTACLLFFQTVLLAGYAYSHFVSKRFRPRTQVVVHLVLLVLALALLPITPSDSWKSQLDGNPTWRVLVLLTASIGMPYFVLSTTAPLLQNWFGRLHPGRSPYRLYALSNAASLLALLSFPTYFEVHFSRQTLARMWSVGLAVFVAGCAFCAWRLWRSNPDSAVNRGESPVSPSGPVRWTTRMLWLFLPAVASVLLLATTNKLTQEVAVVPFLWVLPLGLYLFSFIVCFDHERWYERGPYFAMTTVALAGVCQLLFAGVHTPILLQVAGYSAAMYVACMVCHGELFRLRPGPEHLTSFYLHLAAGGALGSFFVAVVAPAIFNDYRELQIGWWLIGVLLVLLCFRYRSTGGALAAAGGILVATLLVPWLRSTQSASLGFWDELVGFYRDFWMGAVLVVVVFPLSLVDFRTWRLRFVWRPFLGANLALLTVLGLGTLLVVQMHASVAGVVVTHATRNFYGVLKVNEYNVDDPLNHYRLLLNGITTHGLEFTDPERALWPTSYYGERSGVGLAINNLPRKVARRFGFVGLGAGTLAAYGKAGDEIRFYDINPAVEKLATSVFEYVKRSPATVNIVLGDARLSMERELAEGHPQNFDLLALDAFSSDSIPVHLLTREAFAIYLQELDENGVIAVHISNRYLDLQPVVEALADEFRLGVVTIPDDMEDDWWEYRSTWMLLTRDRDFLLEPDILVNSEIIDPSTRKTLLWTDDHVAIFPIIR